MLRVVVALRLDVDRHDLAASHEIAERREVERAPTAVGPGLDDELGRRLEHDLLVDPEIERVLKGLRTEPGRLRPRVRLVEHVVRPRDGRIVEATVKAETG
jgi:hypothetical protein